MNMKLSIAMVLTLVSLTHVVLADDVDTFMSILNIAGTNAPGRVYRWTAPEQIRVGENCLSVQNCPTNRSSFYFRLHATDGTYVAECRIGIAETPQLAERELCRALTFLVQMPIEDYARGYRASRDTAGDLVLFDSLDHDDVGRWRRSCYRTRGNVSLAVNVHAPGPVASASEIAAAVLSTGLQPR